MNKTMRYAALAMFGGSLMAGGVYLYCGNSGVINAKDRTLAVSKITEMPSYKVNAQNVDTLVDILKECSMQVSTITVGSAAWSETKVYGEIEPNPRLIKEHPTFEVCLKAFNFRDLIVREQKRKEESEKAKQLEEKFKSAFGFSLPGHPKKTMIEWHSPDGLSDDDREALGNVAGVPLTLKGETGEAQ